MFSLKPLLLAVVVSTSPAVAQLQFDWPDKQHFPPSRGWVDVGDLGDVDGDGDLDLVTASTAELPGLYINDGTGRFVEESATRGLSVSWPDDVKDMVFHDIDGDLDLDLCVALDPRRRGFPIQLYLNDGAGVFTEVTTTHLPTVRNLFAQGLAFADVDGDQDPDLVVASGGNDALFLNDGAGVFTDGTSGRLPQPNGVGRCVALADVDGDGDDDVILGNSGGPNNLLLNDGTGVFTHSAAALPSNADETYVVETGDVDGDGDIDVVFGNEHSLIPPVGFQKDQLLLNDGSGNFTDVTASRMPNPAEATRGIELVDLDGDGDLDQVVGTGMALGIFPNHVYLNDGSGTFVDASATHLGTPPDLGGPPLVGDVDGDGDPDVVFCSGQLQLRLNTGNGVLADAGGQFRLPHYPLGKEMEFGDLDGDGDLDVVMAAKTQNRLGLNDGHGSFTDVTKTHLPKSGKSTEDVALGDVDGDGDLDVLFANIRFEFGGSNPNDLLLNDGSGRFSPAPQGWLPSHIDASNAAAFDDLDGDGDLDCIVGNEGQNRLYLNTGNGVFADATARLPAETDVTNGLDLQDFDGDGDLDLVCANEPGQKLYLNDGMASFTLASGQLPSAAVDTDAVASGDVDGDGDQDVVFVGTGVILFLNDGSGTFVDASAARLPAVTVWGKDIDVFDIEEDGDLDVLFSTSFGAQLYRNDGSGYFTDTTATQVASQEGWLASRSRVADVDGDADADIVLFAGFNGYPLLLLNLRRQVQSPFAVVSGGTYQLDFYARQALPRVSEIAVPFLSTGTARVPLPPWGTWHLDPATAITLPPRVVPPTGSFTLLFNVPAVPVSGAIDLHAQALMIHPTQWRLSNATADSIIH